MTDSPHIHFETDSLGISKSADKVLDILDQTLLGGLFKPSYIRRVASARAKAKLIEAEGNAQAKVLDAEAEAKVRLIAAKTDQEIVLLAAESQKQISQIEQKNSVQFPETLKTGLVVNAVTIQREQENFESVVGQSFEHLNEDAKPEEIDPDWIFNFYEKGSKISNAEMQKLWAKILAGEANKPGSFSPQALHVLSIMTQKQAETFAEICNFSLCFQYADFENLNELKLNPSFMLYKEGFDFTKVLLIQNKLGYFNDKLNNIFHIIIELSHLGLVHDVPTGIEKVIDNFSQKTVLVFVLHDDNTILFENRVRFPTSTRIRFGDVTLTPVGRELFKLQEIKNVKGYKEEVMRIMSEQGLVKLENNVVFV